MADKRSIKFRAWDSYQNKMYEWADIVEQDTKGHLTLSNLLNGLVDNIKPFQFTGEVDMNGKEIYEGDIVRFDDYDSYKEELISKTEVVRFIEATFCPIYYYDDIESDFEVIGNIHENPELIKD